MDLPKRLELCLPGLSAAAAPDLVRGRVRERVS